MHQSDIIKKEHHRITRFSKSSWNQNGIEMDLRFQIYLLTLSHSQKIGIERNMRMIYQINLMRFLFMCGEYKH